MPNEASNEALVSGYKNRILAKLNDSAGAICHRDPTLYMNTANAVAGVIEYEGSVLEELGFENDNFYAAVRAIAKKVRSFASPPPGVTDCSVLSDSDLEPVREMIGALTHDMTEYVPMPE